jgi:hypothetical protein
VFFPKQDSPTFVPLGGIPLRQRDPPSGLPAAACPLLGRRAAQADGTVYEPCYDDPPAAAESNDQASTADEQVFPDSDQYDPGPVEARQGRRTVAGGTSPRGTHRRNLFLRPGEVPEFQRPSLLR